MTCPFYAQSLTLLPTQPPSWALIPNEGSNRCALITAAHSPCHMRIERETPDWEHCPRNPARNGTARPHSK